MSLANKLFRDDLAELTPYQSARRIGGSGEIWLNANESPYPHDYSLGELALNRYPEFQPPELTRAYADYAGVSTEQLLITRGADEAIELLIRTFCKPGRDSVTICTPTYGMYKISAQTNGCKVIDVPLDEGYLPNVEQIVSKSSTSNIVFLCSPNNPTGHLLPHQRLEALLNALAQHALVVVDEAYIEFAPQSTVTQLLSLYPNLVILRTLSKAFSLAGIRCGFCIASAEVIQELEKVIPPYPVAAPVAAIALQALSAQGIKQMQREVATLNQEKQRLTDALSQLTETFPSHGNFILVRVNDAAKLMERAAANGIVLRNQSSQTQLANCVRITLGTEAENTAVIAAVRTYCQEQQ